MRDNARVEQGGGFEGIFFAEECSDQGRYVWIYLAVVELETIHLMKPARQDLPDIAVSFRQVGHDARRFIGKRGLIQA